MNIKFKVILLLLLTLLLSLGTLACQRNNMPYGGVKNDTNAPAYTQQVNVNDQNNRK